MTDRPGIRGSRCGIAGAAARCGRAGVPRAVGSAGLRDDAGAVPSAACSPGRNGLRALGAEIKRAQRAGDPDTGDTYYRHWLNALERLVAEKGIAAPSDLSRYRDAWHRAADRTPHGMPIALREEDFAG